MNNAESIKKEVMDAIAGGNVRMRPKWHFLLFSSFALVGIALVILTLLYVASLIVFVLRDSGMWFVPSFGFRGWFAFFHAMPWMLLLLLFAFIILLYTLVRKYAFVYRKPLLISTLTIVFLISVGGFVLARTSLHRSLSSYGQKGWFEQGVHVMYHGPFKVVMPSDVYRGFVVGTSSNAITIFDKDGLGTSTIIVTPATRFPYGEDFSSGSVIIVIGDPMGTGTIRAFGIRSLDEDGEDEE